LLICVLNNKDDTITLDEMNEYLSTKVAKFWLPNDIVFVDTLPK